MISNLCRLMIELPERPLFCKDHSFSCHMGYKRLVFPICSRSLNLFTSFTFKMTAPYAAPYSDEEFEKLLQDVNDFPSSIDNPGLGLDFSALPSIDDIDTMTSLCELPPPPPLNNDCSSNSHASFEDEDIRVHQHHMQKQIDCLETE